MTIRLKALFSSLMILALGLGYTDIYFPVNGLSFERLHIFLFNLCSGGTILLYYTERQTEVSGRVKLFFVLSLVYAFSAFFKLYPLTLAVSAALLGYWLKKIRITKFFHCALSIFCFPAYQCLKNSTRPLCGACPSVLPCVGGDYQQ